MGGAVSKTEAERRAAEEILEAKGDSLFESRSPGQRSAGIAPDTPPSSPLARRRSRELMSDGSHSPTSISSDQESLLEVQSLPESLSADESSPQSARRSRPRVSPVSSPASRPLSAHQHAIPPHALNPGACLIVTPPPLQRNASREGEPLALLSANVGTTHLEAREAEAFERGDSEKALVAPRAMRSSPVYSAPAPSSKVSSPLSVSSSGSKDTGSDSRGAAALEMASIASQGSEMAQLRSPSRKEARDDDDEGSGYQGLADSSAAVVALEAADDCKEEDGDERPVSRAAVAPMPAERPRSKGGGRALSAQARAFVFAGSPPAEPVSRQSAASGQRNQRNQRRVDASAVAPKAAAPKAARGFSMGFHSRQRSGGQSPRRGGDSRGRQDHHTRPLYSSYAAGDGDSVFSEEEAREVSAELNGSITMSKAHKAPPRGRAAPSSVVALDEEENVFAGRAVDPLHHANRMASQPVPSAVAVAAAAAGEAPRRSGGGGVCLVHRDLRADDVRTDGARAGAHSGQGPWGGAEQYDIRLSEDSDDDDSDDDPLASSHGPMESLRGEGGERVRVRGAKAAVEAAAAAPNKHGKPLATLERADSFSVEFRQDETEARATRHQRTQAALENMQLEREVSELRVQLETMEQNRLDRNHENHHQQHYGGGGQQHYGGGGGQGPVQLSQQHWQQQYQSQQQQHWQQQQQQQQQQQWRQERGQGLRHANGLASGSGHERGGGPRNADSLNGANHYGAVHPAPHIKAAAAAPHDARSGAAHRSDDEHRVGGGSGRTGGAQCVQRTASDRPAPPTRAASMQQRFEPSAATHRLPIRHQASLPAHTDQPPPTQGGSANRSGGGGGGRGALVRPRRGGPGGGGGGGGGGAAAAPRATHSPRYRNSHRRNQRQEQRLRGGRLGKEKAAAAAAPRPVSPLGHGGKQQPWSQSMEVRSSEVELMLRRPVGSNGEIAYTLAAAEAGLLFMDRIEATARSLGVLRGTLSRWILPYGSEEQSVADQRSQTNAVLENMPPNLHDRISDKEIAYLVRGANSVRKLIRVKIADDNDLNQAKESLLTTARFFRCVVEEAQATGTEPCDLLQARREGRALTPREPG